MRIEKHHPLYPRREWTLRPEYQLLRNGLIMPVPHDPHVELHRANLEVPLIHRSIASRAIKLYEWNEDPDLRYNNMLHAIANASHDARPTERGVAQYALFQLEKQREFLFNN